MTIKNKFVTVNKILVESKVQTPLNVLSLKPVWNFEKQVADVNTFNYMLQHKRNCETFFFWQNRVIDS